MESERTPIHRHTQTHRHTDTHTHTHTHTHTQMNLSFWQAGFELRKTRSGASCKTYAPDTRDFGCRRTSGRVWRSNAVLCCAMLCYQQKEPTFKPRPRPTRMDYGAPSFHVGRIALARSAHTQTHAHQEHTHSFAPGHFHTLPQLHSKQKLATTFF